jgi:hypothetical protein
MRSKSTKRLWKSEHAGDGGGGGGGGGDDDDKWC